MDILLNLLLISYCYTHKLLYLSRESSFSTRPTSCQLRENKSVHCSNQDRQNLSTEGRCDHEVPAHSSWEADGRQRISFFSGLWPMRGYLCSRRWPHTHKHIGRAEWTQGLLLLSKGHVKLRIGRGGGVRTGKWEVSLMRTHLSWNESSAVKCTCCSQRPRSSYLKQRGGSQPSIFRRSDVLYGHQVHRWVKYSNIQKKLINLLKK